MMDRTEKKEFDAVKSMRDIRDRISAEITGKTHDELAHWFRAHRYSDPVLQRLASRSDGGSQPSPETTSGSVEQ